MSKEPKCIDCGIEYKDLGVDVVLPDQQWKYICPENGILCANCISKRASNIEGATVMYVWIDRLRFKSPGIIKKKY